MNIGDYTVRLSEISELLIARNDSPYVTFTGTVAVGPSMGETMSTSVFFGLSDDEVDDGLNRIKNALKLNASLEEIASWIDSHQLVVRDVECKFNVRAKKNGAPGETVTYLGSSGTIAPKGTLAARFGVKPAPAKADDSEMPF